MIYELYYWPPLPGRGEFPRMMFEDAEVDYVDVARIPETEGGGVKAMRTFLDGERPGLLPLAPPFLLAGELVIAQTAEICRFLAPRLGLVPGDEASRIAAHQLQLTLADFVGEAHDTHHPIAIMEYYEAQKPEAKKRAASFIETRMPKYLGYFERVIERNVGGGGLVGADHTYVDLSAFHVLEGLAYALPNAWKKLSPAYPRLCALHDAVEQRPSLAAYLASERRLPFNEMGIFRHYPELDL